MSWRRKLQIPELSTGEAFEFFSQGMCPCGPFWDQILGYWKASLGYPNKVSVLKCEDMKKNTVSPVKRLAEFLGEPFAAEEEERGAVEEIVELCSLQRMRKLAEVPDRGSFHEGGSPNYEYFFRKGEVGD